MVGKDVRNWMLLTRAAIVMDTLACGAADVGEILIAHWPKRPLHRLEQLQVNVFSEQALPLLAEDLGHVIAGGAVVPWAACCSTNSASGWGSVMFLDGVML